MLLIKLIANAEYISQFGCFSKTCFLLILSIKLSSGMVLLFGGHQGGKLQMVNSYEYENTLAICRIEQHV